jgi:hypothetical protein
MKPGATRVADKRIPTSDFFTGKKCPGWPQHQLNGASGLQPPKCRGICLPSSVRELIAVGWEHA